jgi:hypothetical protein
MNLVSAMNPVSATASHLPWAWFAALAAFDLLLAGMVILRRLQRRPVATVASEVTTADGLTFCNGWWVSPGRARAVRLRHPALSWTWPVHHEPLRRIG